MTNQPLENTHASFSLLDAEAQNALLWRHNGWLLAQVKENELLIQELQRRQTLLEQLANSNNFYSRFSGEIGSLQSYIRQSLGRLKELYQTNPTIADLAVDDLVDDIGSRLKNLRLDAKLKLGIKPASHSS